MTYSRSDHTNPSRSRALLGASLALLALAQPSSATTVLHSFSGEADDDGLGISRNAGDLNGDGVAEIVLGTPLHDAAGANAGQVRVMDGASGAELFSWLGAGVDDYLGRAFAAIGDIDFDGVGDLALGAPGAPGSGLPGRVELRSGATGALLQTLTGAEADGAFGYALAGAGDLNGDGAADLYVGAPGESHAGTSAAGRVHVVSGLDGTSLGTLGGSAPDANFGQAIAAGPFMSDGGSGGPPIGAAIGSDGAVEVFDLTLTSQFVAVGADLGGAVAWVDDHDADGQPELLVGSWPQDRALLLSGADGAVLLDIMGPAGSAFGHSLSRVLDVDGDGLNDLAIGAPLADSLFIVSAVDGSVIDTHTGGAFYGWHVDHLDGTQLAVGSPLSADGSGRVQVVDVERLD